ncbi:hypothetical protein N7474_001361 [Penicillium riverlandense]|uniref:uncharacterized protein n=1 Tax=Penicillium riverlandense TaxID=1903569 RepID=UPI00254762C4|nr:uncharacterized protein N7474_001361 [Penicillium riverlandense]KAJ5833050.1 hypothetical protein N7474_001361 [Penicillium riverlandense]
MTGSKPDPRNNKSNKSRGAPKRPPLTHFLCLPLVNTTSLPQLESSLAAFKAAHPPVQVSALPIAQGGDTDGNGSASSIPDGALRPVGTLHLTLGVMSLPSKEQFDEAVAFFQGLDLASLMREAERVARGQKQKSHEEQLLAATTTDTENDSPNSEPETSSPLSPLNVSLESLHALPRAKAATVLHASPVDPTRRLYPFCVMLRDKFIEAGFLVAEQANPQPNQNKQQQQVQGEQPESSANAPDNESLLEELPIDLAEDPGTQQKPLGTHQNHPTPPLDPYTTALRRKPKPRPLLLHATLVNTIYVRGGHGRDVGREPEAKRQKFKQHGGRANRDRSWNKSNKRLAIDARDLIARYSDYYADAERTIARVYHPGASSPTSIPASRSSSPQYDEERRKVEGVSESTAEPAAGYTPPTPTTAASTATKTSSPKYPFVWAHNIPLNSVCICEMGAKTLVADKAENTTSLNARLGAKYTVVAERSLDFSRGSTSAPVASSAEKTGSETDDSAEGGVQLH